MGEHEKMTDLFADAMNIAMQAHKGQTRKDGKTPYILHPISVMLKCNDEKTRIVALLHDVLEDSMKYNAEALYGLFGAEIGLAVEVLTKDKGETYKEYIRRVAGNRLAREVKIADIMSNLETADQIPDAKEAMGLEKRWNESLAYLIKQREMKGN
jgi:guanosine-3',5'-bis(diphosphate) 3'-pyrophosphohydrolase